MHQHLIKKELKVHTKNTQYLNTIQQCIYELSMSRNEYISNLNNYSFTQKEVVVCSITTNKDLQDVLTLARNNSETKFILQEHKT